MIHIGVSLLACTEKLIQLRSMTTQRKKIGRPSKGPRRRLVLELAIPIAERAHEEARLNGKTFTDWATELLSEKLGMPYPYPRQETSPLKQ